MGPVDPSVENPGKNNTEMMEKKIQKKKHWRMMQQWNNPLVVVLPPC